MTANLKQEFRGMSRTRQIGRSASTGRFVPVSVALRYPATHVVVTIKLPARGKRKRTNS